MCRNEKASKNIFPCITHGKMSEEIMKIIIAGCGRVGTVIAAQLVNEHHDITVIDSDEDTIKYMNDNFDVLTVEGDAASADVLMEAGAMNSELLIAVTDSDAVNLLICVVAKKLGVANTIARSRNPIYSKTINIIKEEMGLSFVVCPERDTAKEVLRSLLFKGAGQVETFAKGNHEVMTFVVKEQNPICDIYIRDLSKFINRRILVCAVKRDKDILIPRGDFKIQANDTISFVASRADAIAFFRKMKYETGKIKSLTIIGGGILGFYLADMAIANGILVRMIDKDRNVCEELNERLPAAEIRCGDATDTAVLEECGVFETSAVVTATDSDETNVVLSMYIAKNCPDTKVVTKIKKSDFEEMLYGINLGNVINPKYVAADRIITYVRAMQATVGNEVQSLCHVIDNKVEVLEFKIDKATDGLDIAIQDLKIRRNVLLASITRRGESFIPGGNDCIQLGDTVLVITTETGIGRFAEIFA